MGWKPTGSGASPLTTKGDVYGFDTVDARLGVGTDEQVLTADSAQSLGIKWADAAAGGGGGDGPGAIERTGSMHLTADLTAAEDPIVWDASSADVGGVVDLANDAFVAIATGWKAVSVRLAWPGTVPDDMRIGININTVDLGERGWVFARFSPPSTTFRQSVSTVIFWADAGDDITLFTLGTTVQIRGNASVGLATEVTYSELMSEGQLLAGYSPILDNKPTTDTPDDDFDSATLDGKWTAVSGSVGTVGLLDTTNTSKYDLSTRPGTLLLQVGRDGTAREVELRQDYTIPDGESLVAAVSVAMPMDDVGADGGEIEIGISLNQTDTGPEDGTYVRMIVAAGTTSNVGISAFDGTTVKRSYAPAGDGTNNAQTFYLRIVRSGTTYYPFFSRDGQVWSPLGAGYAAGTTLTNVWIYARNTVSYTDAPIPIGAVRWFRQGTGNVDPWSHTGLVRLESVNPLKNLAGYPVTPGGDDILWSGEDAAAMTEVTVSGSQTISEVEGLLSVQFDSQTSGDYGALLKAFTFGFGDSFAVPIRMLARSVASQQWDAGLIFTDGTGASANAVLVHLQQNATNMQVTTRHGTLTALTSIGSNAAFGYGIGFFPHFRMTYTSANTFDFLFSPDGISWSAMGYTSVSKTMTPTHFGVAWSRDGTSGGDEGLAGFGPIRKLA